MRVEDRLFLHARMCVWIYPSSEWSAMDGRSTNLLDWIDAPLINLFHGPTCQKSRKELETVNS